MRIHAFSTGTVSVTEAQRRGRGSGQLRVLRTMLDRNWTDPLPIHVWAIEHPEGLIVVDAGETARVAEPGWFPRWHPYFRTAVRLSVEPEEEIGPQMRAAGLDPADVRWLVLTHMHTDHAGGLHHFPHSEVIVSRAEWTAATGRGAKLRGYLPQHLPDWLEPRLVDFPAEPFGPFPESLALTEAGDVRLVSTPGHSPGHLSVVLEDGARPVFLAGDLTYTEALLHERAVDGVAPDEELFRRTVERAATFVEDTGAAYLPTHDPGSAGRLGLPA